MNVKITPTGISDAQLNMIALCGLEPRDDGPACGYRRWHLHGWPVGLCYAEDKPLPWGVYWGAGKTVDNMTWTLRFTTALELLEYLSKVL